MSNKHINIKENYSGLQKKLQNTLVSNVCGSGKFREGETERETQRL